MATARTMRPLYVDRLPPCNHACPAGENIQNWLSEAQAGRYQKAWEIIVRDNPLPAVHGRVCYHPCEDACNRSTLDESVSIHADFPSNGKRGTWMIAGYHDHPDACRLTSAHGVGHLRSRRILETGKCSDYQARFCLSQGVVGGSTR